MNKLFLTALGMASIVAVSQAQIITLWDDQDPSGGNLTQIADPFGTGHGNIGEFTSNGQGQWSNYTLSGQDWSAYAGKDWTFTVDLYITAAQIADTNITDDTFYYAVAGVQGGFTDLSTLIPDTWNTITWQGTFDAEPTNLTSTLARTLDNHNVTHPAVGANYYLDNFKLEVDTTVPVEKYFSVDNLNLRPGTAGDPTKVVWAGTPTEGTLDAHPDYTIPVGAVYAAPVEVQLRWTGLTVDDSGVGDDYIDFTFQAFAASGGNAGWHGTGIGDGYSIYTNQPNEGVILKVKDVSVGPGTSGSVEFAGFTSGAFGIADFSDPRSWYGELDINGITVIGTQTNGTSGFAAYRVPENSFTNAVMTYSNAVFGSEAEFIDGMFARDYDLLFSWSTNEAPVYIDVIVTNDIEFITSEGFVDGDIDGQVDWVDASTNGNWQIDVSSTGIASNTNNNDNMTLTTPMKNLKDGDSVKLTVDFKFVGTPDDLTSSTNDVFDGYYMNVGLSSSDAGEIIGANQSYAEAVRYQRFFTTESGETGNRLFKNDWSGPATGNIPELNTDDDLRIIYELSVGEDAGTSSLEVTLTNLTQAVGDSSSFAMTTTETYDALTSATGAFIYVESGTFTHGITGVEVDRIEVIYASEVELVDGFGDWMADAGITGSPAADPDYDYDGDGVANLAEYAINGNPDDINDKGVTDMSISGATVTYSHAALLSDPSVGYILVSTDNLVYGPWTTNTMYTAAPLGGNYEEWSYDVPADTAQKFIKLIITK